MQLSLDGIGIQTRAYLISLPRLAKRLLMVVSDFVFISLALASAFATTAGPDAEVGMLPWPLILMGATLAVPVFWMLGLYRAVVRFLRSRAIISVVLGVSLSAAILLLFLSVTNDAMTLGAVPVYWAFAFSM